MNLSFPQCARCGLLAVAVTVTLTAAGAARAEIIEEIAARINNAVIVRSEMQMRRMQIARQIEAEVPPGERETVLEEAQDRVLFDMINEELLLQQAKLNFDMEKYFDNLKREFMEKNNITSDADLTLLLDNEGLTLDEFRRLLLRSNVPQDVLQFEVARRLAVSGQEIADHYAANLESFRTRGEVTLREIVILSAGRGEAAAAERAAATVARLRAGEDFATVAAEISEAPSRENGGQVGPFQSGDLAPRLEESAFAMPVGEIGEAIATSYGYHILQVVTRTPSAIRPLEEVEAEVENTLRQEKYTRDLEVFLGRLWRENQVVLNPRYATGKLADGGPYATLEELLTGGDPLGPQEAGSGAANGESPRPQEGGGQ